MAAVHHMLPEVEVELRGMAGNNVRGRGRPPPAACRGVGVRVHGRALA
jgi:hypothetical protein